jgi:hypothetical protein
VALISCEKDGIIVEQETNTLEQFFAANKHLPLSETPFFMMAGNAPAFERMTTDLDLHLYFRPDTAPTEVFCFVSDSLKYADSLTFYKRIGKLNQRTEKVEQLTIIGSPTGRAEFRWKGFNLALILNYVFLLEEPTGNEFCGVLVNKPRFIFYDLRNVDLNFSPGLYDPLLNFGDRYTATIYCLDESGWIRNYRSFGFAADSVEQELR